MTSGENASDEAKQGQEKSTARRTRLGTVIRHSADKTVVVEVVRRVPHAKYSKFVRRRMRYLVHDADNACKAGDVVLLEESRPLSKSKRWRVKEITERAESV